MEKVLKRSLLYDFYEPLLTERQRLIYELYVEQDLSLGEIAEELSISRQGVLNNIKRTDEILLAYESKLKLVEKYSRQKQLLNSLQAKVVAACANSENSLLKEMDSLLKQLSDEL